MKTAEETADEIGAYTMEAGSFSYAWQRDSALEILRAALSDAYAAGRAAGIEEAAKRVDGTDLYNFGGVEGRRNAMAGAVRALTASPPADTPASPA